MATSYPTSLDTSTEQPSPGSTTDLDATGFEHDAVHGNHSGALIALETKVGLTDSNAVADSLLQGTGASSSEWKAAPTVSGTLTAGSFAGPLTGNVTGDASGSAATVTGAAQTAITSVGTLTGLTLAGSLALADNTVTQPELTDYAETVNVVGSTGGGTQDIDLTLGNVVSATVDTSANTFTFSNPPTTGKAGSFTLFLTNGGSQTVTWPASVDWAAATAPTLTAAGVDVLTFTTVDGGTIWYGFAAGLAMA